MLPSPDRDAAMRLLTYDGDLHPVVKLYFPYGRCHAVRYVKSQLKGSLRCMEMTKIQGFDCSSRSGIGAREAWSCRYIFPVIYSHSMEFHGIPIELSNAQC